MSDTLLLIRHSADISQEEHFTHCCRPVCTAAASFVVSDNVELTDSRGRITHAGYEFTTLTCIPGMIRYKGAKIQLLDLPGIIEGAKDGKGRGRQVGIPWQIQIR